MRAAVAALAVSALAIGLPLGAQAPDALVDARHAGADGARIAGVRTFRTLRAALAAAPADARRPYVVRLRAGRFREKLSIDRARVTLLGAGRDSTVVTWDDAAGTPAPGGGTLGTRGSWTLRVTAPDFRAERLTIENAFDYPANARKTADDPTRLRDVQGVALALTHGSDRAVLLDVRLSGHQDTFFADAGRAYLRGCEISGHVDFIFGSARAVFEACDIVSRDRGDPRNNGYVTAPSTDAASPIGFLFVRSRLRKEHPRMAANSVALGRPWHPSATPAAVGSAVFLDCWMDDHITVAGWDRMSSVDSATQVRYWFEPAAARFFEARSTGPGAVASPTRRVLGEGDVRTYTIARTLGDWSPDVAPPK
ncbi:MAG: pectinesterase family protein [Gemmatirosa sp.]